MIMPLAAEAEMEKVDLPIFIIGPHRSGTGFLANILKQHPRVVYVREPSHIWNIGNRRKDSDRLAERDLNPSIRKKIRNEFASILLDSKAERILEKTPSNCLRIPFIKAIFPEAKIIFLVRDGRSVISSTVRMRKTPPNSIRRGVWVRMKETPLHHWPKYINRLPLFLSRLRRSPPDYWGPKPDGWRDWVSNDDLEVVVAKQWAAMIETAVQDLEDLGDEHLLVRYEDLVADTDDEVGRILSFCQLPDNTKVYEYAKINADPSLVRRWEQDLSDDVVKQAELIMRKANLSIGYEWM